MYSRCDNGYGRYVRYALSIVRRCFRQGGWRDLRKMIGQVIGQVIGYKIILHGNRNKTAFRRSLRRSTLFSANRKRVLALGF